MRKVLAIWLAVVVLIAAAAGRDSPSSFARSARLPISAQLSTISVHPNDSIVISVQTVARANLVLTVSYPGGSGFKKKGTADGSGHWVHVWQVHASVPGTGSAQLFVQSGSQHRYYTLTFTVLAAGSSTPMPTPTATSTPASGTPTTPTSTPIPTLTPTPTSTATPIQPANFVIRGLRIELPRMQLDFNARRAPLKQTQIGQTLRFSLYSNVVFSPANPGWHTRFMVYRNGVAIAHHDLHPVLKKEVRAQYFVDTWTYTPTQPGTYSVSATLTLTGITRRATASIGVTLPFLPVLHESENSLHVGQSIALWITSPYWPSGTKVAVSFTSADHTFKGAAAWKNSCRCFGVKAPLAKKLHGPEIVRTTAQIVAGGRTTWLSGHFTVIGLTPAVSVAVNPDPISYGTTATLSAATVPGARCSPSVVYSTDQSPPSFPGHAQTVGKSGKVSWTWHMTSKGTSGAATVSCIYRGATSNGSTVFSIA